MSNGPKASHHRNQFQSIVIVLWIIKSKQIVWINYLLPSQFLHLKEKLLLVIIIFLLFKTKSSTGYLVEKKKKKMWRRNEKGEKRNFMFVTQRPVWSTVCLVIISNCSLCHSPPSVYLLLFLFSLIYSIYMRIYIHRLTCDIRHRGNPDYHEW